MPGMVEIHVIPVYPHQTVEEAALEQITMGKVVGYRWWWRFVKRPKWAVIRFDRQLGEIECL